MRKVRRLDGSDFTVPLIKDPESSEPAPCSSAAHAAGGALLLMTRSVSDLSEGRRRISEAVAGGAALSRFQAMMEAQGVAADTARTLCATHTDYYRVLRKSARQTELKTPQDGLVLDVDGLVLAEVLHKLGAGRSKAGEPVNHSVGAELLVSLGQRVGRGVSWLRLHYENPDLSPDQINQLQNALVLVPDGNPQTQQTHTLVKELLLPQLGGTSRTQENHRTTDAF